MGARQGEAAVGSLKEQSILYKVRANEEPMQLAGCKLTFAVPLLMRVFHRRYALSSDRVAPT